MAKATTVPINRLATVEAGKANAIYAKKRTAVYKNTHQRNASALRNYIRHNSTQIKAIIAISRTDINNI
jgi:hypothetical protein